MADGMSIVTIGLTRIATERGGTAVVIDLPPLKWSSLMYVFDQGGRYDGKEEAYS
jgi:hypothetical protein